MISLGIFLGLIETDNVGLHFFLGEALSMEDKLVIESPEDVICGSVILLHDLLEEWWCEGGRILTMNVDIFPQLWVILGSHLLDKNLLELCIVSVVACNLLRNYLAHFFLNGFHIHLNSLEFHLLGGGRDLVLNSFSDVCCKLLLGSFNIKLPPGLESFNNLTFKSVHIDRFFDELLGIFFRNLRILSLLFLVWLDCLVVDLLHGVILRWWILSWFGLALVVLSPWPFEGLGWMKKSRTDDACWQDKSGWKSE